jgi:hypothetical protein
VAKRVIGDLLLEFLDKFRALGPWAHEFKFADHDVEELREFVDPRLPKEIPDPGDPWVVLNGPDRVPVHFRVIPHRPEFINADKLAVLPHPDLGIEHGTRSIDLDQDRYDKEKRKNKKQPPLRRQSTRRPF